MKALSQCLQANIPNPARLKEFYLDVTWHQPGVHTSVNTILLIAVIVTAIVALAAICALVSKR